MHNTGRADYTVPDSRLNDSFFDVVLWQTPLPGPIGSTSLSFYDGAGPDGADILVGTYHWPKGIQAVDRHTGGVFWSGNPDGVGDNSYPIANDNDDEFPLMAAADQYERLLPVINLDTGQDFATVQAAVDSANTLDGHRIVILPGTYTENANITKQLTLESALGEPNDTIIEAANTADHVFEITADNVTVRNLSFRGATDGAAGLYVYGADGGVLENNHCGLDDAANTCGIQLEESTHARLTHNTCNGNVSCGIQLAHSDDNELSGNTCDQNGFQGIRVQYSDRITVCGNTASGSGNCGMYLSGAAGCTIDRNRFLDNSGAGVSVMNTDQTVLTNNIANNNTGGGMCLSGFVSSPNTNAQIRDNTANNNRISDGIYVRYLTGSTLSGNTATDNDQAGLHLESGSGNTVSGNTFERNQNGIYMKYLNTSTISGNALNENGSHSEQAGIYLDRDCTENQFSNNTFSRNSTGFYSYQSYTNTLTGNTFTQNDYNLGFVSGSYINGFVHTIDTSNTVDGKPVYYLVNKHHRTIPADAGFVGLVNCSDIVVKDLTLSHNIQSVLLSYATNCLVCNVTVTDNVNGIHLQNSVDNTIACCTGTGNTNGLYVYWVSSRNSIYGNNFSQNTNAGVLVEQSTYENILYANTLHENTYGIYLRSRAENNQILANSFAQNNYSTYFYSVSRNNVLYLNDFNSCAYSHVLYTSAGPNTWSSPNPLNYRYNGSAFTSRLGNHWNNYGGSDGDGDGIGDSIHTVYGSETDPYPLIAGSGAYRTGVEVTAALTGGGRPVPDGWELPLSVAFHSPGADVRADEPLWTFLCLTRRLGGDRVGVQIPPIPSSTYDITARGNHTLTNVRRSVSCLPPAASADLGTLIEGNADNNDGIDLFDYGRLSASWLDTRENPDFDHDADFNRDGEIDLLDLDMLTANWLAFGPVELP
ncbi:MAG: right-handed parallel beta-helix repeat-containing protein [Sedimentisphaerales bacterium]|nr:right-handed parallel beta-helix repeat-containing protein [Sedimentisphaerales bacterium]